MNSKSTYNQDLLSDVDTDSVEGIVPLWALQLINEKPSPNDWPMEELVVRLPEPEPCIDFPLVAAGGLR